MRCCTLILEELFRSDRVSIHRSAPVHSNSIVYHKAYQLSPSDGVKDHHHLMNVRAKELTNRPTGMTRISVCKA